MPCSNGSRINPRLSRTALGLPGRLTINVFFRITDTPRPSMARLVSSMERYRIYSAIPGAFRSATAMVASGVWSRMENPVPPLVTTRSSCRPSARRISCCFKTSGSSGSKRTSSTWYPACSSISFAAGPLSSFRFPAAPLSLNTITAAEKGLSGSGIITSILSPGRTVPSRITLANTPCVGMMHSPIR